MPIICKVTRGALTESFHVVFAVAVDETGQTVYSTGDPNYLTCIRSALKPFQAAAAVKTGAVDEANFSDKEIALMCASHTGEEIHVNTAQSMLGKIGLTLDDFECGIHPPSDTASHHKLIKDGKKAKVDLFTASALIKVLDKVSHYEIIRTGRSIPIGQKGIFLDIQKVLLISTDQRK